MRFISQHQEDLPILGECYQNCFSFATLLDTEEGAITETASGGFCLVARIKKDNSKNATSHIAVISMTVLLRGILTFGITKYFYFFTLDSTLTLFHTITCIKKQSFVLK
jgi:hypothetical protein